MALQADIVVVRMYQSILGMIDAQPDYAINKQALAECLNMRVERGRLLAPRGRAKENTAAMNGASETKGMQWGEHADGTQELVVATNGGYWTVDGNTKTLISTADPGGSIALLSAGIISGTSACEFLANVSAGDMFYFDDDGVADAIAITSVSSDNVLEYAGTYAGDELSGAYTVWDKQPDLKTQIGMHLDRWLFVNGQSKPMEYTSAYGFREIGLSAASTPESISATSGGSMSASVTYAYKVCWQDARGKYGMPCVEISAALGAAQDAVQLSGWGSPPSWVTTLRFYRTKGDGTTFYYHSTTAISSTTWDDTSADSALTVTQYPPTENYQPPISAETFAIHKDRAFWMRGSRVHIGGLDPVDDHTETIGRWEPEYAPARQMYLGRDEGQQSDGRGFFKNRGRLYALQSDSTWALWDESVDPNVWHWYKVSSEVGCESLWSIAEDGQAAYWLGRRANRLTVVRFSGYLDFIGDAVQGTLDQITATSACVAGCGQGLYRLSIAMSAVDRELEWQTDRGDGQGAWAIRDWRHYAYAASPASAWGGGSAGFIYKLDYGRDDADSAISRQLDYPAVGPPQPEDECLWQSMQFEVDAVSAISAISAWYKVDGGAWATLSASGFPISAAAGTLKMHRTRLPNAMQGRHVAVRFKSTNTDEAYEIIGVTLKGQARKRDSI